MSKLIMGHQLLNSAQERTCLGGTGRNRVAREDVPGWHRAQQGRTRGRAWEQVTAAGRRTRRFDALGLEVSPLGA